MNALLLKNLNDCLVGAAIGAVSVLLKKSNIDVTEVAEAIEEIKNLSKPSDECDGCFGNSNCKKCDEYVAVPVK